MSIRLQSMEGFGASDAWSIQYVGLWPEEKKNAIADLLFSNDMDLQGNPIGIGLNTWRFNIGAGSKEQGSQSNISDPWRRTEGFLQDDLRYDWTKQAGQQWFLQAAQERGVNNFIAFVNSPPIQLSINKKANTSLAGVSNLAKNRYEAYADFLAEVLTYFKNDMELTFTTISPLNEPQWDWTDGQEGCPFTNTEIISLSRVLSEKLIQENLSTLIELAEAGEIKYLFNSVAGQAEKDQQIDDFFGSESEIASLTNLSKYVSGHSYWSTDESELIEQRTQLWDAISSNETLQGYVMSEYCIMDYEEMSGNGRDLGILPALYVARVIHYDLTIANASSWQWWLAVSPYDYKDGLIYIDKSESDGEFSTSKILYALGNYSRFIEPGMQRVDCSQLFGKSNADEYTSKRVMSSAFASENNEKVVIILVNYNNWEYHSSLELGAEWNDKTMKLYRTSESENLRYIGDQNASDELRIAPQSITTITIEK